MRAPGPTAARPGGSTGIGRAVAARVVAEGGAVVIAGRRTEPGMAS